MAAVRFASMLLLIMATVALATDATRVYSGASTTMWVPLGKHWADTAPGSFAATRKSVLATSPALWEHGVANVIRLPGWLLFGSLGAVAGYIGRHRRRINIFTN